MNNVKRTMMIATFACFAMLFACVSLIDNDGNAETQIANDEWTHVDTYQELIDECAKGTLMIKVDCDLVGDGSKPVVIPFLDPSPDANEMEVPDTITVDLCGHTVNRNLSNPTENGYVFLVKGSLMLMNGSVTGGNNSNIIEGEGGGAIQVINENLSKFVSLLTMDSVTVYGNRAVTGGGIYVNDGIMILKNCEIRDNVAEKKGGGAYVFPSDTASANGVSEMTIIDTKIHNNSASNGGGMFVQGISMSMFLNSYIYSNTATEMGGGLYLNGGGILADGINIYGNVAGKNGGGIMIGYGVAEISNSRIYENNAGENGGGICADVDSTAPLRNVVAIMGSTIEKNAAGKNGGGIYVTHSLFSTDSKIDKNKADENGGGICSVGSSLVTVEGGSVDGNVAGKNGGGLYVKNTEATSCAKLSYCEVKGNSSENAGGLCVDGGTLFLIGKQPEDSLDKCTITENSAKNKYGAIWLVSDANGSTSMTLGGAIVIKENMVGDHFDDLQPEYYAPSEDYDLSEETELWIVKGATHVDPEIAEYCQSDDKTKNIVIDGDGNITYLTKHFIRLDACGGSIQSSPYYVDGCAYPDDDGIMRVLPTPTKAGYVFTGWFTDRNGGNEFVLGEELTEDNLVLYAHWQLDGKILTIVALAVIAVAAAGLVILFRKK